MDRLDQRLRTIDPRVVDVALAAILLVIGLAQAWPGYVPLPERWSRVDWIAYVLPFVLAIAVAALMLVRRRQPILVFALAVALLLVDSVRGSGVGTVSLAMAIATYGLGRLGTPRRDALVALAVGIVVVVGSTWALSGFDLWALFAGLTLAGLWWVGDVVRDREARIVAYEEGTARLEAERRHDAAVAAAAERARIARELHDVIAHNVSVMVVQAAAAASVLDRDPEAARRSLGTDRDDRPRGAHRDAPAARRPPPGRSAVVRPAAVARPAPAARRGDARRWPAGDPRRSRVTSRACRRASTCPRIASSRRRSPTCSATPDRAPPPSRSATGRTWSSWRSPTTGRPPRPTSRRGRRLGGHGLAGMRERVALVHGQLEAGPLGDRGFRDPRPAADRRRMSIRVLIVDDQALLRTGFRMILEAEPDL